jgi:hypothetical protein
MKISGPDRYVLTLTPTSFTVECSQGTPRFSGLATSGKPKLYVISVDGSPIYVGITKQPMRNRLRYGWSADGRHGYHGYAWRHHHERAVVDVWYHEDAPDESTLDIETVEAEVVFLIRAAGQWPLHQTEIHFHPSKQMHRDVAVSVMTRYAPTPPRGCAEAPSPSQDAL